MEKKELTGIILAGGKSSRMGQEKGLVNFRGKPMIAYSIEMFEKLGYEIIIVANDSRYEKFGFPVFKDTIEDKGPMAGIYTGLQHSTTAWNAVITCDVPLIDSTVFAVMEREMKDCQAIMPRFNGRLQPLTAMYQTACQGFFLEAIHQNQLRVRELQDKFPTKIIDFGKDFKTSFTNINTQEDIQQCK